LAAIGEAIGEPWEIFRDIFLLKPEISATFFFSPELLGRAALGGEQNERRNAIETFCTQPEAWAGFPYLNRS
jgi:hypothetical protein